jgi:hypothetical protein
MRQRLTSGKERALRFALALSLAGGLTLAGHLIFGHTAAAPTHQTTFNTTPTLDMHARAQLAKTVAAGCAATSPIGELIAKSVDGQSLAPLTSMEWGPGSGWSSVTAMQLVGSDPPYRSLANDTIIFMVSMSSTMTSGNLSTLENALTTLTHECNSLDQSVGL